MSEISTSRPILQLYGVFKSYSRRTGIFGKHVKIHALRGIDLQIRSKEILGLVGESGCGKSTLARLSLGLEAPDSGFVYFKGLNLFRMNKMQLNGFRRDAQMVFQDPFSSLNPKKTVFQTLSEPFIVHSLCKKDQLKDRVAELMTEVGLTPDLMYRYPHEFSGGQRQRIGLARALATRPSLIVADEPTSALDVSIQAQIINLLLDLHEKHGISFLFISHDLLLVRFVSHRIVVMYRGNVVEIADSDIFSDPDAVHHPYTAFLLDTIPIPDPMIRRKKRKDKSRINNVSNDAENGCHYRYWCPISTAICAKHPPLLRTITNANPGSYQAIACHNV